MKVLNLYAGVGGNRKHWTDCEVTAVESNEKIAAVYQRLYPNDTVIVSDAHEYLVNHYEDYDFIWSSPPCQSHSQMMKATRHKVAKYPDMSLYQEIIFLTHFFKGKWVVENVAPYYDPLIKAQKIGRHLFWSNFYISVRDIKSPPGFAYQSNLDDRRALMDWLGIHFEETIYYEGNHCPSQVLRNCVHPDLGLQIFQQISNKATGQLELMEAQE